MSDRKIINTVNAPQAIGPYSQGICYQNFVYTFLNPHYHTLVNLTDL